MIYNISKEWSEDSLRDLIKDVINDEITEYHWKYVAPLEKQLQELGKRPRKARIKSLKY